MELPSFSVVLVNYKTYEITRICLDLLREPAKQMDFSVWVVDNDSQDASTVYLRTVDWIHLIERKVPQGEPGFMGHGLGLDMVLERIDTDYLFLLHTDTFIHDPDIFRIMLKACLEENAVAVGCLEQIYRGQFRIYWRLGSRYVKHHIRRLKAAAGIKTRPPAPYREKYIKSFCSLWNTKFIREHGWTFSMDGKIPSYAIQDRLMDAGQRIKCIPPRAMFRYLDHIEAGTVAAAGTYGNQHRRTQKYLSLLEKYRRTKPSD